MAIAFVESPLGTVHAAAQARAVHGISRCARVSAIVQLANY